MNSPSRPLIYAILALLTLIWGSTWAAIRIGLQGIPPVSGVALRFGIASLILLGLAWLAGVRLGRSRWERRLWWVNALLTFSGSYGIVYWAEQWVPSGLAAVLFATFPLFVAVLAHLVLPGERLTGKGAAGVLLGFLGVTVIFSEDLVKLGGQEVARAAVLFLLAPFISALGNVATKRWGQGIHPFSVAAVPMGITGLLMGAVAAAVERNREFVFDLSSVGALLYLALCGSALTFSLYFWLLARIPATQVSLVAYTSPVLAVLLGTLFLGEPYTLRMAAGSALVVAGVALAVAVQPRERIPVEEHP